MPLGYSLDNARCVPPTTHNVMIFTQFACAGGSKPTTPFSGKTTNRLPKIQWLFSNNAPRLRTNIFVPPASLATAFSKCTLLQTPHRPSTTIASAAAAATAAAAVRIVRRLATCGLNPAVGGINNNSPHTCSANNLGTIVHMSPYLTTGTCTIVLDGRPRIQSENPNYPPKQQLENAATNTKPLPTQHRQR